MTRRQWHERAESHGDGEAKRAGLRAGAVRIGVLGSLTVSGEGGRPVEVGGQLVRKLLILLALDAGRIVPAYSLIERLWDDDPPANAANSLQSLVSRLRASLRRGGVGDQVIESHPAGRRRRWRCTRRHARCSPTGSALTPRRGWNRST